MSPAPALTRERIDQLIDDHFRYEATDDVDAVVASLTPDAAHHVVPSPVGPIRMDFAKTLTKESYDDEQFFRFGAATKF